MASVYKRRELRPIPEGATITTYRGKPCATWTDAKGKTRRATLGKCGRKIVQEAPFYTVEYFDESGKRRKSKTRCGDKDAALQIAAELEKQVMLRKRGLVDPVQEQLAIQQRRPFAEHARDFRATMEAARRDPKHVAATLGYLDQVRVAGRIESLSDLTADVVNIHAADLLAKGKSARTVQAVLTAVKSFTRWLARHGKLPSDPLASVHKPSPRTDRRRRRRMLLPNEWQWLQSTTDSGPERFGMTGHERMLLYAMAIQTGLRAGELRSLTRARLFLDQTPSFVTCNAGDTKNKQAARQYLQSDLAELLRDHAATKAPGTRLFAMPHVSNVARMFQSDLQDARRAWLAAAQGPEDRVQREQSDFLAIRNHDGEQADFHSLRHTCGAWLAQAGNHPKTVQAIMRHSSITLTMDAYGHLFPGQDADAVAKMPSLLPSSEPQTLRATGTDNAVPIWEQIWEQSGGKTLQNVAVRGESPVSDVAGETRANVLPLTMLGESWRDAAEAGPLGFEPRLTDPESVGKREIPEENEDFAAGGSKYGSSRGESLAAADWRAEGLRAALEQVAEATKGRARTLALAALDADRVAFPTSEGGEQ